MYQEYEEYGEDQLHTSGPIVPNKTGFLRQRVVGAGVANSSGFESARNNRCYIPVDQSQILPQRYEPYQRPVLTTPRAASRPPAPVISAPQPRPVENELEKAFSMEIDVNRPLLSNLMTAIQKHRTQEFQIDINKAGVVLSKYHREGVLDRMSLHVAEEALGRGSLRVTVASDLGVVSRSAYQFGNNLMLNILAKKMSSTEPPSSKSSEFHFRHQFQFVTMQFNGSYPFKTSAIVTTRNCMKSVDDPQRSMSRVIRVVLLQILDDPRGHQNFALRQEEASNSKTPLVDLPDEVFLFLERFCFETYGLFPRLRHPGYSYQDLRRESLSLAAILGRTEEEGESKFNLLLKDADAFAQVVFLKVQRTLNDLRKKIAQHPRRDDNGHFNGKFVADPAVEAIHTAGSAAGSTDRSEEYRNSESPDQQNEVEC